MLGGIAVEKEIYACETAQICVCLHIGELIPLGESSYTSHYIFNSIKYFFLVHDYALLLTEYNTLMLNAKLHISCEITIDISMKFAATVNAFPFLFCPEGCFPDFFAKFADGMAEAFP